MENTRFELFRPFKPDKRVIGLYNALFAFFFAILAGALLLTAFMVGLGSVMAACIIFLVIIAAFYLFWVRLYYGTIFFELKDDEMTWRRGVWFRMTGIVPYDRITNLDIYQGPLMRFFSISCIRIQTAGYSVQRNRSEITLEGIVEAEELRETIRSRIREARAHAGPSDATGTQARRPAAGDRDTALIDEVRAIRRLLDEKLR